MRRDIEQLLRVVHAPGFTYREASAAAAAPARVESPRREPRAELAVAFASPLGGAGRTTLAANVTYALARSGRRAVGVDLDPGDDLRGHFARGGGRPPPPRFALGAAVVAPACAPFGDASAYLDALAANPDALVLVAPAGLTRAVESALASVDEAVMVLRADAASYAAVPAADAFLARLRLGGRRHLESRYVVNAFDARRAEHREWWAALRERLGPRLWPAPVQWDAAVRAARVAERGVHEVAPSSQVVADLDALASDLARAAARRGGVASRGG
jgi:cellulose biosynthesis protein BcsQ